MVAVHARCSAAYCQLLADAAVSLEANRLAPNAATPMTPLRVAALSTAAISSISTLDGLNLQPP